MPSSKNLKLEQTSFLNKSNSAFIESMYLKFVEDDPTLPLSWKTYFQSLDEDITSLIESIPSNNRSIVTTHESLGYLEIKYGINVLSTIIPSYTTEDGTTPKGLVSVIETIKENQIKTIFLESESPTKAAEVIADETGAILVSGLWVETLKENQSYIDFMKTNLGIIVDNLQ